MCPLQAVFFTSTCAINWPKYGIFSRVVCISEIDVWVQDASNKYTKASSKIVSRNNRFSGGSFSKYLVGTNCVYSTVLGPGCSCVWDMVPPRADSVHLQRVQHPRPSSRPTGSETGAAVWVRQAESHQPWGLLLSVPHRLAVSLSAAHVSASPGLLRCKCSWIL